MRSGVHAYLTKQTRWLMLRTGGYERHLLRRCNPVVQVLLWAKSRRWVKLVAGHDPAATSALRVPYADPSAALGLTGFVLGLDGASHAVEAGALAGVIADAAPGHLAGLGAAGRYATAAVPRGTAFDVGPIIEDGVLIWAAHLLGVDQVCVPGLRWVGGAVVERTYRVTEFLTAFDGPSAERAQEAVDTVERFRVDLRRVVTPAPAGTVRAALGVRHGDLAGSPPSPSTIRDIIGLTGGPVELTRKAAMSVVSWALADSRRWSTVHSLLADPPVDDEGAASQRSRMRTVVSSCPPEYLLPRWDAAGKPVLVRLWREGGGTDQVPDAVFGAAPHRCLGEQLSLDALIAVLTPVFAGPGGRWTPPLAGDAATGLWITID